MPMMGTHLHQEPTNSNSNNNNNNNTKTMRPHQRGGTSESSTTSDNTTDFIDIVKKHDVVYNTHHPDYKNVEVKLKVWTQIAKEIGLSVDASKRKWKNLRDSYTKYLRSFRAGSKTSRKYQFWAHAEHMEFLKPFQGPGRSNNGVIVVSKEEDETECDLGYQVLTKASTNSADDDVVKSTTVASSTTSMSMATSLANVLPNFVAASGLSTSTMGLSMPTASSGLATAGGMVLPVPSLPTVQLPPSLTAKPIMGPISNSTSSASTSLAASMSLSTPSSLSSSLASLTNATVPSQVFAMPSLSAKGPIPMPASNTASSVGCLIIEPQLFASADTFKKEFTNTSLASSLASATTCSTQITPSNLHIYPSISPQVAPTPAVNTSSRLNPPLMTKIRRVQPSPQQTSSAFNFPACPLSSAPLSSATSSLSFNIPNGFSSTGPFNTFLPTFASTIPSTISAASSNGPSPAKRPKNVDSEISAILMANRELDANTLFFLSLARSVRSMPTKLQSLAKMRCMRIVSDIELELDNLNSEIADHNGNTKYCTSSTDSPPPAIGGHINDPPQSEHFVYVMSPSRVEGMIDLSSDDETTQNGMAAGSSSSAGVAGGSGNINASTTSLMSASN